MSQATQFTAGNTVGKGVRQRSAMAQTAHIQRILSHSLDDKKTPVEFLPALARAWKELEYLKRDIKFLPKAKPIDVLPPLRGPGGRLMRRLTDAKGRSPTTIDVGPTEAPCGATSTPTDAIELDTTSPNPPL